MTALVTACLLFAGAHPSMAQRLQVRGVVTDNTGAGIIGAAVVEKGNTSNGAVTDLDGNFTLSVAPGAMLEISCISYVSREVPASENMNIVLQEDQMLLDEVLVVGYGVQRKSNITGAISKVDESDMLNRSVTNAQDALGGKTSGVQMISTSGAPGEASTIRVRGYSSNYSSDPLYIVDGLKVANISNLDANDIQSIEILKDAASAAIYGAEAGNGVILVTTKQAKAGTTRITYDFQYAVSSLAHLPKLMNAQEYMTYHLESGRINQAEIDGNWDGVTDNNWYKSTTENGLTQKHTLSFQTATEKAKIFLSGSYLSDDGFLKGDIDTHDRYNMVLNAEMNMSKWLTVGANSRFSYSKMNTLPYAGSDGYATPYGAVEGFATGPFTSMGALDPLTAVYYEKGGYIPASIQGLINRGANVPMTEDGRYYGISQFAISGTTMNPLMYMDKFRYNMRNANLTTNLYANITPVKGLVFTSRFGFDLGTSYINSYFKTFTGIGPQNYATPQVSASSPLRIYYQWENFANYTRTVGRHTFGGMLGMSVSERNNYTLTASANNLTKEKDNYAYLAFAAADAVKRVGGQGVRTSKLSYFGRVNYNYADRYMAEVTFRADAADLSVLSKNNRWGYFPAISLGWIASNEAFFPKTDAWTYAKLRASWGQNGSLSSLGNFMYARTITSPDSYSFDGTAKYQVGSSPAALGNYDLRWETAEQLDFGLDLRFFRDRLAITADYYIKDTKDLLITGSTPSLTSGNNASPVNAGNVRNQGLDLDVSWRSAIGDFSYGISGNIATLKNKVTYLDQTVDRLAGAPVVDGSTTFTYFEKGYPIWYMRGFVVERIDPNTGDPVFKDVNGDGEWTDGDVDFIGSAIPDFTYGITLNAAYKNIDLVVFGSGSQGNDIFNNMLGTADKAANEWELYFTDRWTPQHTDATRPRAIQSLANAKEYARSDANVFDGSYFKIKQIQVGYTLPKSLLKKIHFENVRAYVSVDDFFTFTKYPGMDPETASHNSTNAVGIDSGSYPSSKKVVFGVNVTF